jgi:hypothetical protein
MRLEVGAKGTMSEFDCIDCIFNNQEKAPKKAPKEFKTSFGWSSTHLPHKFIKKQ